jgi:Cof subfamily protein (haloacid dehalogenase superfamily)
MTEIKLFASDLDGTFLNNRKSFSKLRFTSLLKKLDKENKYFVASSGRSFNGINKVFGPFNKTNRIAYVGQNGGLVYVNGKVIFESSLDVDLLKKIFDAGSKISVIPNRIIFEGRNNSFAAVYQIDRFPKMDIRNILIKDASEINEPIQKVSIHWNDADQELLAQELISLSGIKGVDTTSSGYGSLDIINKGISKAVGLQKLGDYLEIHGEEMAAFGDGDNDLQMLYYVGHPFVMPNAPKFMLEKFSSEQRAAADNNHSGVIKTINHLL